MKLDSLLIIFAKNPELGKVKTRLAKTIGDKKALELYNLLLDHTHKVAKRTRADKAVFFSDHIPTEETWRSAGFLEYTQNGSDLGSRMMNAFKFAFDSGYKRVLIIGSDCLELTEDHLSEALLILKTNEIALGPARDGGYYLIGMKQLHRDLFLNKEWSTENVLLDTLVDLSKLDLSFKLLPTLTDIDEEKDLHSYPGILDNEN